MNSTIVTFCLNWHAKYLQKKSERKGEREFPCFRSVAVTFNLDSFLCTTVNFGPFLVLHRNNRGVIPGEIWCVYNHVIFMFMSRCASCRRSIFQGRVALFTTTVSRVQQLKIAKHGDGQMTEPPAIQMYPVCTKLYKYAKSMASFFICLWILGSACFPGLIRVTFWTFFIGLFLSLLSNFTQRS